MMPRDRPELALVFWVQDLLRDLRHGLRILVKNPSVTIVSALVLGLGIGATTALFSVIDGVLLRPLRYDDSERLVRVFEIERHTPDNKIAVSPADFIDWRERSRVFEGMAALLPYRFNLIGDEAPEQLLAMRVTADFFPILRAQAALGRVFLQEEFSLGDSTVVVISHRLWQRLFGGSRDALGKTLAMDGKRTTIVGVMPAEFQFTEIREWGMPDCWIPQELKRDTSIHDLAVIARLKPAVPISGAQAELEAIARQIEKAYPKEHAGWSVLVLPLIDTVVGDVRPQLLLLFGAVVFVLLIACANVANLLLARAASRRKEIAMRTAFGAGRLRLVRQLVTESILLSLSAGLVGVLLAAWGVKALILASPQNLPRLNEIGVNERILGFTLLISMLTGIIFGIAPAFLSSKTNLPVALKDSSSTLTREHRGWLGNSLVVIEIALAFVLLIGAGLIIQSFIRLQAVDLGFNPKDILSISINLPMSRYRNQLDHMRFWKELLERVEKVPGIECAGIGNHPLFGLSDTAAFNVEGEREPVDCAVLVASPNYFRTLGIQLLQGRLFTPEDTMESVPVAVINRTMALRLGRSRGEATGKRIALFKNKWISIVGIVEDVKARDLESDVEPTVYLPHLQNRFFFTENLVLRSRRVPSDLIAQVRREVREIDKDLPITRIVTMAELIARYVAPRRFNMMLISLFSALGLILAAIGTYSVMAHAISLRTHEIGVRMALGAQRRDVLLSIIGRGLILVVVGQALGFAGSLALNKVMSSMVFRVATTDPLTYVLVSLVCTPVALVACYVPARRATNVDPMIALRYE